MILMPTGKIDRNPPMRAQKKQATSDPNRLRLVFATLCAVVGTLSIATNALAQISPVPAEPTVTIWADPLQGGPIDSLFIGPESASADFSSLARRLQIKSSVVTFAFETDPGVGRDPRPIFNESELDKLTQALRKPRDVVVLARIRPDDLSRAHRMQLRSLLEKGTGLLLVLYGADEAATTSTMLEGLQRSESSALIERGFGSTLLAGWADGLDTVLTFEGEHSRAAEIAYWANAPHSHCLIPAAQEDTVHAPTTLNNYFSLVARALCWAAGRDPALRIESIEDRALSGPDDIDTPPQLPREFIQSMRDATSPLLLQPYELRLDRAAKKKYRIRVQARYPYRNIQWDYTPDETIEKGDEGLLLHLPVGFGECFLDFWILDRNTVVDWFTKAVRRDGWPEISDVQFSSLAIDPNDSLEVSMNVRSHFHRPRPCMVFVRATDSLGRIVAEESVWVSKEGGPVTVELQFVDLLAPYLKLEVFAVDTQEGPLNRWMMEHSDYTFAHVLVRRNAPNTFRFVTKGTPLTDFNLRAVNRSLSRHGVDTIHLPHLAELMGAPAMDNLDVIPTLGPYDLPSWDVDPALRIRQTYALEDQALNYRLFGAGLYLLNSEEASSPAQAQTLNVDARTAKLQRFLRERYPNLTALNEAWGSAHLEWSHAAAAALAEPNSISTRMDLASFEENVILTGYLSARNVVHGLDPHAQVGLRMKSARHHEGLPNSPSLLRRTGFILVRPESLATKRVGDFRTARSSAMLKIDGALSEYTEQFANWLPWYAALHRFDGIWLDREVSLGRKDTDDTASPEDSQQFFEALAHKVQFVRSGYSELLKRALPAPSSIALYDSQSSVNLDALLPAAHYSTRQLQERFANVLDALGYAYDMLDYEGLVEGQLRNYRLCILPFSRALSNEEIMALRQFHTNGGALLADVLPGRYDEHATPRSPNPFDEIFGVETAGNVQFGPPASIQMQEGAKRKRRRTETEAVRAERSVRPLHTNYLATSGDTPIAISSRAEEGQAFLLNYSLGERGAMLAQPIDTWMKEAGALKRFADPVLNASAFSGTVSIYDFHGAEIYAFLRMPAGTKSAERVRLPVQSDRHAYDLLTAKHFRPGSTASFKVMPGEIALLSSLEYEVSRVKITVPKVVGKGSRLPIRAVIKTRGALPKDHIVQVELTAPDGSPLPHYSHTLDCPAGQCGTYIPLALNDSLGAYTVTVRDVLSGTIGHAEVLVH